VSSGFNTDIRVADRVFHVQTEDRGPGRLRIDTAVYQNGRVLHRRSSSYEEFASSAEFTDDALRLRVEQQHRGVIEELRSGAFAAEVAAPAEQPGLPSAIEVQLLNPASWLSGGNVTLEVQIVRRADGQPQPGIPVEASILGALKDGRYTATSDDHGRVLIRFPLPPLGRGELALIISAAASGTRDEIRLEMRSRPKGQTTPATGSTEGS